MGRVLSNDEICPDGMPVMVPWARFIPGTSVFIPCIAVDRAVSQFTKLADARGIGFMHKIVIENRILGVRFWRTT